MAAKSSKPVILNEVRNLSRLRRSNKISSVRWITAPQGTLAIAPVVQGVALAPGEDVQWLWMHTLNGSYVSGYNIMRRVTPRSVILSKAKNLSRTSRPKKRQRPFAALRVTKSNC